MKVIVRQVIATSLLVLASAGYPLESSSSASANSRCLHDQTQFDHSGTNLIRNGDLEQGTTGEPREWSQSSWGELEASFSYPVAGCGGGKAAELTVANWKSGDAALRFTPVLVSDDTVYSFSDKYRSNVVTKVTVEYLLSTGVSKYEWLGEAEATGGAWKVFSSEITVPKGTVSLTVLHGLEKSGSLTIDNAILKAAWRFKPDAECELHQNANANENLIQNGDLEQGEPGEPRGWRQNSWGKLKTRFSYPATGCGGGKAAELVVADWKSGATELRFAPVSVSDDTVYSFSDKYSSNVISHVTVEYVLSTGASKYLWLGEAEATGGAWKVFSSEITVPKGTVSLTVLHGLEKSGSLTIDSASLEAARAGQFAQGMVALVFDDGLASQFENARPILQAAGLKATFAIITQAKMLPDPRIGQFMDWDQIRTLHDEKNEIAAHTRTHPDLGSLTLSEVQEEIAGSYQDLVARGLIPKTLVYPYGSVDSNVEGLVRNAGFAGARGSYFGLNSLNSNKFNLHDIHVDKAIDTDELKHWIDQAIAQKRWLVLELHDVVPSGGDEYSITPEQLQVIVTYIKDAGIKVVTLEEGILLMSSKSGSLSRNEQGGER